VEELYDERLIQPHFRTHTLNNSLRRIIADGCNHRINRHNAADHESDNGKSEQRD
jgi:hypothetical protein